MLHKFADFVNESYLDGGRQPLYHSTRYFINILDSDKLKISKPTFDVNRRESISLSRSRTFSSYGDKKFMLNVDKLIMDGYVPKPFDEIGSAILRKGSKRKFHSDYTKSNPKSKEINHNIANLETGVTFSLEAEYEERIYKTIENLGKYVIEILISDNKLDKYRPELIEYIKKYPHILVTNESGDTLLSIKDIEQVELKPNDVINDLATFERINIK
jgi:hypothetical protein